MEFKNQYLKYNEYMELGGTLDEAPFNILELKARKCVDKYTFGRLMKLDEQINEVKICIFELIKYLASYENYESHDKAISSESTDGYSISYNVGGENVLKGNLDEIKGIVRTYLDECRLDDGTPYLYIGVSR